LSDVADLLMMRYFMELERARREKEMKEEREYKSGETEKQRKFERQEAEKQREFTREIQGLNADDVAAERYLAEAYPEDEFNVEKAARSMRRIIGDKDVSHDTKVKILEEYLIEYNGLSNTEKKSARKYTDQILDSMANETKKIQAAGGDIGDVGIGGIRYPAPTVNIKDRTPWEQFWTNPFLSYREQYGYETEPLQPSPFGAPPPTPGQTPIGVAPDLTPIYAPQPSVADLATQAVRPLPPAPTIQAKAAEDLMRKRAEKQRTSYPSLLRYWR